MTRMVADEHGRVFLVENDGAVVRAENLDTGQKCEHPDRIIVPEIAEPISDFRFWAAIGGAVGLALVPVFVAFVVLLRLVFP